MPFLSDEAKQLIRDATDVESLLRTLGFNISRTTGSEVRAPCILHGGDNPTAFSVRLDTKKWRCFTKKCELDGSGRSDNDLIALVRRITGRNFVDAVQFLAEAAGLNMDLQTMFVEDTDEYRRRRDSASYIKAIGRIGNRAQLQQQLSEEQVLGYVEVRDDYFVRQGFQEETLALFEVGSMTDRRGVPRATVPIREASGLLVSLSARRTDCDSEPRYLLEYEFQKGRVLYNMHRALATGEDTVIVVEGFKALWALHEAGFDNVVACMGANMSPDQVFALCASGFRNCLILFDGDKAGVSGAKAVNKKLSNHFNLSTLMLPDEKSPDDFDRVELNDLVLLFLESF